MSDAAFLAAVALGAGVVIVALLGSAVVVAVVLRHRDKRDLEAEGRRVEASAGQHAKVMDEMRDLKNLTLRAIGGRAELEAAVKELTERVRSHHGRIDEHSGSISELRERLGLNAER